MSFRCPTLLLALALCAPLARADFITGQVVDVHGVGVAGVDIDAKSLSGGGNPSLFNDGTDANGFFTTTIPAGFYRISFLPPPPPASTSLYLEIDDVIVSGVKNLGVIVLPAGVSVSGHVQTTGGLPVVGINIDVYEESTGSVATTLNDKTDALGNFSIAAPLGAVQLRLDASLVVGATLASKAIDLNLGTTTALGTLVLPNGFHLTATVKRTNATAVVGANTNTFDAVTGDKLYTPHDTTSATGLVDVVVPAGTYDFEVCPTFAQKLVATTLKDQIVAGPKNLGVITLQGGVTLSGTVRNAALAPVGNVDLDVRLNPTGAAVTLCGDNTAANGTYAIVVPIGVLDVTFSPPLSLPYGTVTTFGVNVVANTVLNATLPDCPFGNDYGTGLAGLGGLVPTLGTTGGAPVLGNPGWTIGIANGRGGAFATLVLGFGPATFPFKGGTLLVDLVSFPVVMLTLPLSGPAGSPGAGAFNLALAIPDNVQLIGLDLYMQAIVSDAGADYGFALSNGRHVEFCP